MRKELLKSNRKGGRKSQTKANSQGEKQPERTAWALGSSWVPAMEGSQEPGSQPRSAPRGPAHVVGKGDRFCPAHLAFLTGGWGLPPFLLCFTPLGPLEHTHQMSGHSPGGTRVRLEALDRSGPGPPSHTAEQRGAWMGTRTLKPETRTD